nr:NeuD/PglB/VioB family sugar acetyltransferase [Paenibacillus terrigena]
MGNNDPDTEQEEFNKIIIIGAGGVGKGIYQIIEDINKVKKTWDIIGFIDENEEKSKGMLFNLPVFGSIDVLNDPFYAGVHVTFAIGNPVEKMKLIEKFRVKYPKVTSPTLIHPTAIVSNEAKIGVGTVVNALVVIEPHSYIGDFVLVYYGCMIGHDSMIEDYVSLLPQSNVSGDVVVKKCASLGSNSTIIQGIEVGEYTVVGAGAVVLKSLPAQCTAVGVPAKAIKFHHEMKVGMLNG